MTNKQYYLGEGTLGDFDPEMDWLTVSKLASGYDLKIPVMTIEGTQDGPTLGLTAGVHGDEHTGVEIVRRVLTSVAPAELMGRIKAMPVVNPLAFETITRNTPLDMLDLNRVFPGARDGWLSQQIAAVLCEQYFPGIDYLIDIHAGGHMGWVDYVIGPEDRETSLASGSDYVFIGFVAEGTMKDGAKDAGVKSWATFEFGGTDTTAGSMVDKGVRCTFNLMKHWGMLPGEPELPARQYIVRRKKVLRSMHGGLFYHNPETAAIGNVVPQGALLGRVVSPYTFEVLEEMRAPFERNLIFHVRAHDGRLNPGEYVFQCGDMSQTEVVENQ